MASETISPKTVITRKARVYLQLPGTAGQPGQWVTAGHIETTPGAARATGLFQYAPEYLARPDCLAIDPIGLPRLEPLVYGAPRYGGLCDVIRDICPDSWGRRLLMREKGLPAGAPDVDVVLAGANSERWGALSIGSTKHPSPAHINTPRINKLSELLEEMALWQEFLPARHPGIRQQLLNRHSDGGARPKVTVRDGDIWLIAKPLERGDVADIPRLEHLTMALAKSVGLHVAATRHLAGKQSVVLVERFDRQGEQRVMAVSGATLMEVEFPAVHDISNSGLTFYGGNVTNRSPGRQRAPGYLRLADALRRIGCPLADLQELWHRLVFNILVGNDDDHPRNHAALYDGAARRWRLSPAFDIVPNPLERPRQQAINIDASSNYISREVLLALAPRFGFTTGESADALLSRFTERVIHAAQQLPVEPMSALLFGQIVGGMGLLGAA